MASTADESTASTVEESAASTADEDSMLEDGEAGEAGGPVKQKKLKKKKKKASLDSETSGTILNSFSLSVVLFCPPSSWLPDIIPRLDSYRWQQ